jgi:hypothetical protein
MRLSDAQKLARAHIPSAVDADGWVVYSQDLSFKSGEEIELEIVPKGIDAAAYPDDMVEPMVQYNERVKKNRSKQ